MLVMKKYAIWIVLLMTLAATFLVANEDEASDVSETLAPVKRVQAKRSASEIVLSKTSNNEALIQRPEYIEEPHNIFTVFVPANDTTQENVQIETAPENPFTFSGKLVDDGEIVVFLTDGQINYSVKLGDTLNGLWQIQSISPPMMTIKYIPLNIEMQMHIGALS